MTLRRKILAGYGLVLGLVMIVWVWAVLHLYQLGRASEAILRENYRSILAAENMINTIERQDSGLLLLMLGYKVEGRRQFHEYEVEFLHWLSRAKDNITLAGEPQTLQTIEQEYLTYLDVAAQLSDHSVAQAPTYYHETVLPKFNLVRQTCIELREMNQQAMLSTSARAQEVSVWAIWSMAILGVIVTGLGLGLSLWLSNILVRPLREMTLAAGRIAEGDYDVTIQAKSADELGRLAKEIMIMSHKLKVFHELNVSQVLAEKQRGEAIIRSITDGLVVVDAEHKIVAINPMAAQILQTTSDQARGKHFFDVVKNQALYEYIKTTAETGQPPQLDEPTSTLALAHDDQTQYYHFAVTSVKTEQGQMMGVVLLLQDVTKLKELDRLKSEFVITASHELRTPLTSIAMSIGLLEEKAAAKLAGNELELLQVAQEDVQRLRALVNNLLDLSKIESGRMEMEFEPVRVQLLANRAISTLTTQVAEKGLELIQQMPDELPRVKADPNKITWVLTNLMANALRYTDPGGHIWVRAEQIGDFVYLSVADDGAGIPLEYQAKIFDKFVQVKNDKAMGGTGLGLAICKEIIKAHGGTIWVDSVPDQGSTFTFTMPVVMNDVPLSKSKGENSHV